MAAGGERFKTACITVLGSGYAPFASGSWGSLTALVIYAALALGISAARLPAGFLPGLTLVGIFLACWASVAFGEWAIQKFGSKDPKPFVLDEFAGQWMALLFMPVAVGWTSQFGLLLISQLFFFRLMDVWKPSPARELERLPAGWGVLCDDLMAGVYANLLGQIMWRWIVNG